MAMGGRLGADLDLDRAPVHPAGMPLLARMYAESASRLVATVRPENQAAFEALFAGQVFGLLGRVGADTTFTLRSGGAVQMSLPVEELARAFKSTLAW
jgi:phosphoribosylformylglycinamidine synthase